MWFWWIFSVLILASAVIFALSIFFGGYKITPVKKDFSLNLKAGRATSYPFIKQNVIAALKLKLQTVENNSLLYFNEFKKLQQRIEALEKGKASTPVYNDENWEELYYQKLEEKEKLENELDSTTQKLEVSENNFTELKLKESGFSARLMELENQIISNHSSKNKVSDLQQQLKGALGRERDLQQELELQKKIFIEFELLQKEYARVQSEADELKNIIREISNRDVLLEQKINRLAEQESNFEISEYEKTEIKKTVEEIILENEALAAKLHDLQEKLGIEKFA